MKFKYTGIHKMSIIQGKFPEFFNLLRGMVITRSVAGSVPLVVHPCYTIQ